LIGVFLINDEDRLGFVQYGEHKRIKSFRLHLESNLCLVELEDGQEDCFDDGMHDEIRNAFKTNSVILVGHLTDANEVIDEYEAPVVLAA
jgi:hypothetical protein